MILDDLVKKLNIQAGNLIVSTSGACALVSSVENGRATLEWNNDTNRTDYADLENIALMVHYGKWEINPD
jgi:hypothetical protein